MTVTAIYSTSQAAAPDVRDLASDDLTNHIRDLSTRLADALGEHVSRTHRVPSVATEVLIEQHVLDLRDSIGSRALMVRRDGGARLLARLATSAQHAADDLTDKTQQ